MKVNALIAGVQKGGTTALFHFLRQHPDICVPTGNRKELHFFDDEGAFLNPSPHYRPYEALFPASACSVLLEATPIYSYWAPSAERIAAYNSAMRLVLILRDPVERAYSQWEMEFSRGSTSRAFADEIASELRRLETDPSGQDRVSSYVARGFYGAQIQRLLAHFPIEQLLILRTEDLRERQRQSLNMVTDFFGINRFDRYPPSLVVTPTVKSSTLPPLDTELANGLRKLFSSDLALLNRLTNLPVADWI